MFNDGVAELYQPFNICGVQVYQSAFFPVLANGNNNKMKRTLEST